MKQKRQNYQRNKMENFTELQDMDLLKKRSNELSQNDWGKEYTKAHSCKI